MINSLMRFNKYKRKEGNKMALIKCPECGKEISNQAYRCPNCGILINLNTVQVPVKKKGLVCSWVSMIITSIYAGYSIPYWIDTSSSEGGVIDVIAGGVAATLVFPHLVSAVIALIFNMFAIAMYKPGFALTSAILYSVSLILFPMYWWFVVAQAVLMYIAFARMKSSLKQ